VSVRPEDATATRERLDGLPAGVAVSVRPEDATATRERAVTVSPVRSPVPLVNASTCPDPEPLTLA
jgi:hypothetical protein